MDLKQHLYLYLSSSVGTWCHAWCIAIRVVHNCEIWCNVRIGSIDIWFNLTYLAEDLDLWALKSENLQILLEIWNPFLLVYDVTNHYAAATSGVLLRQKQAITASLLCRCCNHGSFIRTGPNFPHVTVLNFMVPYYINFQIFIFHPGL